MPGKPAAPATTPLLLKRMVICVVGRAATHSGPSPATGRECLLSAKEKKDSVFCR